LLHDITPAFISEYDYYLTEQGKSATTISIYLRQLRAIINQAINAGVLSQDKYPFKKMELASGMNTKKALPVLDLKKLLEYKPIKKDEAKALDYWLFSYLCSGINFADIIELKPENIIGNTLSFRRVKTKRTKKNDLRPITIGIPEMANQIIQKWKNIDPENPFLFPILELGLSPVTVKHRCQRLIKWVNKRMDTIRLDLKIQQKVGTYAARHSFATVMKNKNQPIQFIKESLGHSSEVTTERYLGSFPIETKIEIANLLTDL
jgi:integrase